MDKTIFITHLPAFYKVNLYNEISKKKNISAWFLGSSSSEERSNDFVKSKFKFDSWQINSKSFQERFKLSNCLKIFVKLKKQNPSEIIISGWDLFEFWAVILLFKKINCL